MNNMAIIIKYIVQIKNNKCFSKFFLVHLVNHDKLDIINKDNAKIILYY